MMITSVICLKSVAGTSIADRLRDFDLIGRASSAALDHRLILPRLLRVYSGLGWGYEAQAILFPTAKSRHIAIEEQREVARPHDDR
jgi:hypothetical protein